MSNKANVRFCLCPNFIQQSLEVYQVLYGRTNVERNEVVLYICRMVWAAVVLKKKVDWRTIKQAKNITMPKEQDIPMGVLKLSHEGLNLSKGPLDKEEEEDDSKESKEDNDSNGTRPTKVNTAPGPKKALKALHDQNQARLHNGQPIASIKGAGDVLATVATSTSGLPSIEPTTTIEAASTRA
jgi:hypothetical protein